MKRIFLTGASSGIGLALARMLVKRGDEVWGTSRDAERLPRMERFHPVTLDLLDPDSVERGFQAALAEAGYFDVLINNAGSGHFGPSETLSQRGIVEQFQILVFAQIQLVRMGCEAMRRHGGGLIINVTSLAARLPVPFMAAYNAAKAALVSFTTTMQVEFPDRTIRLVDLQPADIRTNFNAAVRQSSSPAQQYAKALAQVWNTVEKNMQQAPGPELVARRICSLMDQRDVPPRVTVGDRFQAAFAPLILRLIPMRLLIWSLKKYYGI